MGEDTDAEGRVELTAGEWRARVWAHGVCLLSDVLNLPFYSVPRWGAFLALPWGITFQHGDTSVLGEGVWNLCNDAKVWAF